MNIRAQWPTTRVPPTLQRAGRQRMGGVDAGGGEGQYIDLWAQCYPGVDLLMPKYLIEVEHEPTTAACNRAIAVFLRTGSHFLTHADWGCKDNVHKAWFTLELDSKDEALSVVPADYRHAAKIVQLTKFNSSDLDKISKAHGGNR